MGTRRALLLLAAGLMLQGFIITRHDIPDQRYIACADSLSVTPAVIRYNQSDVAGTLIAPTWILSAAHVAQTLEPGDTLLSVTNNAAVIRSVILHPGWVENGRPEDIALIELDEPVAGLPTVAVYAGRQEVGQTVIIIGNGDYGTGLTGPQNNDGRIRAATNRVDRVTDEYLVWTFDDPTENPDAVTRLEGISGPGDSSGPALIRAGNQYQIAGISSAQRTSATGGLEGRYGVTEYYTRVSTYVEWIAETIVD